MSRLLRADQFHYDHRGIYQLATVRAGIPTIERIVPPAGEEYAFERADYPLEIQVCVSPTGRSVRLHVNGVKIDWKNLK